MEDEMYNTVINNTGGKEKQEVIVANPMFTDVTGSVNLWGICQDDTIY